MQTPLDIPFRGLDHSLAMEAAIMRWSSRLDHVCDQLQRCAVVIELPHRHQRHGHSFHVRIELTVPGRTIATTHAADQDPAHEDVYVAIADAFRAARRQLLDHVRVQRGDVKQHAS